MAGRIGREKKFTNSSLRDTEWTTPTAGKSDETISDKVIPALKLRVRHNSAPTWYVHFSHPRTKKRIRQNIGEIDLNNDPKRARELAQRILDQARDAKFDQNARLAFDKRDVSVADIVEAYIDRLENETISRSRPTSAKTIASYRADHKHISGLYTFPGRSDEDRVPIRAIDLTSVIIEEKNAENKSRIQADIQQRIDDLNKKITKNLRELNDRDALKLTPRNIKKRLNQNIKFEDKIARYQNTRRTGATQNKNSTALIKAAFKAMSGRPGFPTLPKSFDVHLPVYKDQKRSLTEEEADALIQRCEQILAEGLKYRSWKHACLLMLLIYSGARRTELMTADVATLKFEDGLYSIECLNNKEKNPTKRVHFLPGAEKFVTALVGNKTNGALFDVTNHPDVACKTIVKQAGILDSWTGFHALRHTFASKAKSAGLSLPKIADLLGQTTMSVTQTYGYIFEDTKVEALRTMAKDEERRKKPAGNK